MKKVVSAVTSAALILSSQAMGFAADKEARQPDVFVNAKKIVFADQNAYITDEGRTLVPARGVFEALGCKVEWDAENYVVNISDEDQQKNIVLTIDDVNMKVVTGEEEAIKTLDVPAQLMNDRTMIPLRAVSEALDCMVMWDESSYAINISEMKSISADKFSEIMQGALSGDSDVFEEPKAFFSFDKAEAKPGEEVELKLMYKSEEPVKAMGIASIEFDSEAVEIVDFTLDDSIKELVDENLSKYTADLNGITVLFKSEQTYDGCLGTIKIKLGEDIDKEEIKINAISAVKNDATRTINSTVEEGTIIIAK